VLHKYKILYLYNTFYMYDYVSITYVNKYINLYTTPTNVVRNRLDISSAIRMLK
jgi:hypothetical protein